MSKDNNIDENIRKLRHPIFNIFLINDRDKPKARDLRDLFCELLSNLQKDPEFTSTTFNINMFEHDDIPPSTTHDLIIRFTHGALNKIPHLSFDYDIRILFYAIPIYNDVKLETPFFLGRKLFEWEGRVSKVIVPEKLKSLILKLLDGIVLVELLTGYKPVML